VNILPEASRLFLPCNCPWKGEVGFVARIPCCKIAGTGKKGKPLECIL
jgi:hypothetical protein